MQSYCTKEADPEINLLHGSEYVKKNFACRDVYCTLIFFLFWVGMVIISGCAYGYGDTARVFYASDYNGNNCGKGTTAFGTSRGKYVSYPRLSQDLAISIATGFDTNDVLGSITKFDLFGVCRDSCPGQGDYVCTEEQELVIRDTGTSDIQAYVSSAYSAYWSAGYTTVGLNSAQVDTIKSCWLTPVATKNYFFRCFPRFDSTLETATDCVQPAGIASTDPGCITMTETVTTHTTKAAGNTYLSELFTSFSITVTRWMNDVVNSWYVIFVCGLVGGFILSWCWVVFVQYCAGPIIWLTIAGFYIAWIAGTLVLYVKGGVINIDNTLNQLSDAASSVQAALTSEVSVSFNYSISTDIWLTQEATDYTDYYKYGAYVCSGLFVVWVVVGVALFVKFITAIRIIQEASSALRAMPMLVFFPIITITAVAALTFWWIITSLYIFTIGEVSLTDVSSAAIEAAGVDNLNVNITIGAFKEWSSMDLKWYIFVYHLFGLYWTLNLLEAIGLMVVAGSVVIWYFTPEVDLKDQTEEQQARYDITRPLFWSIKCSAVKVFIRFMTCASCFNYCCCHCFCHKCGKAERTDEATELTSIEEEKGGTDIVAEEENEEEGDGTREAEGSSEEEEEDASAADADEGFGEDDNKDAGDEEEEDDDAPIEVDVSDVPKYGCLHNCVMYPIFWILECAFPGIRKPDLPACVCCTAWFRAFRYHFGTLAVTSFIIAVVQLVQTVCAWLLVRLKTSGVKNPILEKILYAVQGALTALQCCIKHINKSMYSVVAMRGQGFFASLQRTGVLLLTNILTVSALKISSLFIIILGKALVTLFCAAMCYIWLTYDPTFDKTSGAAPVTSIVLPFLINAIICFLVATAFFYTYEMTIEAILMAFLEDMTIPPVNVASHNQHLSQTILGFYRKKKKSNDKAVEVLEASANGGGKESETDKTARNALQEHSVRQKNLKKSLAADKQAMRERLRMRIAGRGKSVDV
jgi:hypothetical protein